METRSSGAAGGSRKRTGSNLDTAPRPDPPSSAGLGPSSTGQRRHARPRPGHPWLRLHRPQHGISIMIDLPFRRTDARPLLRYTM